MADFTPDDTFTSPVPALSDGQPANAAVLNAPHQALVNRTHWLKETIDSAGITRDGATRIREVADEAALKALTGMQDGELAITQDKGLVFRFRAGVASSDIPRWVVQATSNEGLWVNTAFQLIGGPNGLVWRDANERMAGTFSALTLEGPLTMGDGASVRCRVLIGPDDDTTIENGKYDIVISGALTAHRAYKLTSVGAAEGNVIRIVHSQQPGDVTVIDDSINVLATLEHGSGDGSLPYKWSALFVFTSGAWTRIG